VVVVAVAEVVVAAVAVAASDLVSAPEWESALETDWVSVSVPASASAPAMEWARVEGDRATPHAAAASGADRRPWRRPSADRPCSAAPSD